MGYLFSEEEEEDENNIYDKKSKQEIKEGHCYAVVLEEDDITHELDNILEEGDNSSEKGIQSSSG